MSDASQLLDTMMDLDPRVRFVEVSLAGRVESRGRSGPEDRPGGDSREHEDPFVDPVDLGLVRRGGGVDRAGSRSIVIRRGSIWQLAIACRGGRVSIGVDLEGDPLEIAAEAAEVLLRTGR